MQTPVFRSQIELEKYMDISVTSGEGLFNHNPSLLVLQQYYKWLISRSNNMKKLICEFNKRTLVLKDKEYQILVFLRHIHKSRLVSLTRQV